jgi:hypothetical protein
MHDISYNEEVLLDFVQYDNSSIGNVQVVCKGGELKITKVVDVKRHDDAYIIEMHLGEFAKIKIYFKTTLLNFIDLDNFKKQQQSTYGSRS